MTPTPHIMFDDPFPGPQHKLHTNGGRDENGKKRFMCRGGGADRQMRETMNCRLPVSYSYSYSYRLVIDTLL